MHSDHRQPGCAVIRAALALPRLTTSTLVLSGVRVSSGESKLFMVRFAIRLSSGPVFDDVRSKNLGGPSRRVICFSANAAVSGRLEFSMADSYESKNTMIR